MMNGVIRVEDIHVEFRDSKIQDDKPECTTIPTSSKQLSDKIRSKNEPLSFCNPIATDSIYSEFRNKSEDENRNNVNRQLSGVVSLSDDILMVETALQYYNSCSTNPTQLADHDSSRWKSFTRLIDNLAEKVRRIPLHMIASNKDDQKPLSPSMKSHREIVIPEAVISAKPSSTLKEAAGSNASLNGSGPSTSSQEQQDEFLLHKPQPPFNANIVYGIILFVILILLVIAAVTTIIDGQIFLKPNGNSTGSSPSEPLILLNTGPLINKNSTTYIIN